MSTTTTTSTTTLPPTTTTTLVPEESLVVVIANASDTYMLATDSIDQVRELGYVFIIRTDGLRELASTVVYYLEGFELEARRFAQSLDIPIELVEPRPEGDLVEGENENSQILLILGNDWRETTNLDNSVPEP